MSQVFYAYRKAKADCFYERSIYIAREFANYEGDLVTNLNKLFVDLKSAGALPRLRTGTNPPRIVGKKLEVTNSQANENEEHIYFSAPDRSFENTKQKDLSAHFRLVGDFSVDAHIISALWVNLIGQKFDAVVSDSAFGSRLRRYRGSLQTRRPHGDYHLQGLGSFEPYFKPYQDWRRLGLDTIKSEIKSDNSIIAMSLDFTSYYHNIDPTFMVQKEFLDEVGVKLSEWEIKFTSEVVEFLLEWSEAAKDFLIALGGDADKIDHCGIPIGISVVRIISNVILFEIDRDINEQLSPLYYGRYVDDLFLVLRDPGGINNTNDLWKYISARSNFIKYKEKIASIEIQTKNPYWGKTKIILQKKKQKIFFLSGTGGLDLLESIESQIRSVSSERRLMPSANGLADMASAHVLAAAGPAYEEADTLRRADGLAVRRLAWAVQLRSVETLARNLRSDDWKKEREDFYEFARNHIIRPDKILEHFNYLPRLLSIAIALEEWTEAKMLVDAALGCINTLRERNVKKCTVDGIEILCSTDIWNLVSNNITMMCADAIIRAIPWRSYTGEPKPLPVIALKLCFSVGLGSNSSAIHNDALKVREADWALTSYKDHLRHHANTVRLAIDGEESIVEEYEYSDDLREFLLAADEHVENFGPKRIRGTAASAGASNLPYVFPTRPYTAREIALFLPNKCISTNDEDRTRNWAKYVRGVRGVWVRLRDDLETLDLGPGKIPGIGGPPKTQGAVPFRIGRQESPNQILLGISSLATSDDSWEEAAAGKSSISKERYERVRCIVNQALTAVPRPNYLLLPELSLPERWLPSISATLADAGINLIVGLDYQMSPPNLIHSSAAMVLEDDSLGFVSWVEIRQPKALAAPAEDHTLQHIFGKEWVDFPNKASKPVYIHNGFSFGVLVCSELQNMSYRKEFQGAVDCVVVLSWNKDLETFSALVDSTALDVHSFIALTNNRRFGDSRVKSPAKLSFERDICRLRGGLNEHLVVVKLDVGKLRSFQNRAKRWPSDHDEFKPVPEEYKVAPHRKVRPK